MNKGEKAHNLPLHGLLIQSNLRAFCTLKTTPSIQSFVRFLHETRSSSLVPLVLVNVLKYIHEGMKK